MTFPFDDPGFDDVDEEHPFFLEISWLADRGITTGFDDGEFKISRAVARQAMAAFLFRFADEDFPAVGCRVVRSDGP